MVCCNNITVKLEEDPLILMKGTQQNNIKCYSDYIKCSQRD